MAQTHSTFEIDALLRKLAKSQDGLITVAEAEKVGVDRHALLRRRDAGALVSMHAGVMRLATLPESPHRRILAAALAVPGSVIAGISAAIIHNMPLPRRMLTSSRGIVLCVDASRRVRRSGIEVVRLGRALPSTAWMTARVATPSATLVLLSRYVQASTLERCVDDCLANRTVSVASVQAILNSVPRQVVAIDPLARLLLDRSDGLVGHRSGLEQQVAGWLDDAGLVGWSSNYLVPVPEGDDVEVDFGWIDARVALEVSPFATHGSRIKQKRDAERRDQLTLAGWSIVEALDADVVGQRAFARKAASVRALLDAA
jgi:hypothetical protein